MNATSFAELPIFGPPDRREGIRSRRILTSRRRVLQGALVAGMAGALQVVGLLPPLRRANAGHGIQYEILGLPCVTWTYNQFQESCDRPCGPSTIFADACVSDQSAHYFGYHKASGNWDLRPNVCADTDTNSSPDWDGWKWLVDTNQQAGVLCNGCADPVYRCHDGWYTPPSPNDRSVCKKRTVC
jgi:hypothetical protein